MVDSKREAELRTWLSGCSFFGEQVLELLATLTAENERQARRLLVIAGLNDEHERDKATLVAEVGSLRASLAAAEKRAEAAEREKQDLCAMWGSHRREMRAEIGRLKEKLNRGEEASRVAAEARLAELEAAAREALNRFHLDYYCEEGQTESQACKMTPNILAATIEAALLPPATPEPAKPARPRIVCLCGSTRFKEQFEETEARETDAGRIVLTVGRFGHRDGLDMSGDLKRALDELHKRKIDLADEVLVIDVGGYIGQSTRSEIEYAEAHGKPVRYLSHATPEPKCATCGGSRKGPVRIDYEHEEAVYDDPCPSCTPKPCATCGGSGNDPSVDHYGNGAQPCPGCKGSGR